MSYAGRIKRDLHRSYPGLKDGPGLAWLDSSLVRLNGLGYTNLVQGFLSNMKELGNVTGFLLEINLIECLLKAGLDQNKVMDEHCVGGLIKPVDATYEDPPVRRADFQCKFVNSYYNELAVNKLCDWIDVQFVDVDPGGLLEIQPSAELNARASDEFKAWFTNNIVNLPYDRATTFTASDGKGRVTVVKGRSDSNGIFVGLLATPVPNGQFAVKEDIPKARQAIQDRYDKAVPTFAYPPSITQQNFLVMDIDSLSMLSERQVYFALYGQDDRYTPLPGGEYTMANDGLGLYALGKMDSVSGVILLSGGPLGTYDAAVFPHPSHEEALKFWLTLPQFRRGEPKRR